MSRVGVFDPFRSPILQGINLIEASAGTGKTFSIAMLVLRAVVELGLKIDEIQVVTYTSAATEELRERIRARLLQARQQLSVEQVEQEKRRGNGSDQLGDWLATAGPGGLVRQRLDLALLDIDRAPIQTIHAFCQTVLQEQALESGQLFDLEVTADLAPIRDRLVEDFWRTHLYPLAPRYARLVCSAFAGPSQLYRSIAGAENLLCEVVPASLSVRAACDGLDRSLVALGTWWSASGQELLSWLSEAREGGYLLAAAAHDLPRLAGELAASLEQDLAPVTRTVAWLTETNLLATLHGVRLRSPERKNEFIATAPLPGAAADAYLAAVEQLLCAVRVELALFLRSGLSEGVRRQGLIGFDDLITGLADAVSGPSGAPLCRQVGARYRMALIDEFQDTDSAQWSIFSRLFGSGDHYLYLIGDPKQAIYRFRGADICSYFLARQQANRCLTLQYNFRAHPDLMAAINRLLHGVPIGGQPYRPVLPARTADQGRLVESGRDGAVLLYCQLGLPPAEKSWSSETAGEAIAAWVVAEAARLLSDSGPRFVIGVDGDDEGRAVHPEDIAVLVRSNFEAATYQQRFRRLGIPAVVTGRHSVFQTPECESLLQVLQAIAWPTDRSLLKTALSCDWFGLDGREHYRIGTDETALSTIQQRFHLYLTRWQEQGFLPMFTTLLRDEQILRNIGCRPDPRRRLANVQHLAELVQQHQQRGHLSCEQTITWLHEAAAGNEMVEDALERLADDGRALQIVTMHSAKGLEFHVVFCPSLLTPTYQHRDQSVVFAHDEQGRRLCDLGSERFAAHRERELDEEREEHLRLAYVAITRATLRCYLLWADIAQRGQRPSSLTSPLGHLLFAGAVADYDDQVARLQDLGSQEACGYRLIEAVQPPLSYRPETTLTPLVGPRVRGERPLQAVRTRTSFSALAVLGGRYDVEQAMGAFDERGRSPSDGAETLLPGGVRFGSVVHEILEEYDFGELAAADFDEQLLADRCRSSGLAIDIPALRELLRRCVTTTLLPVRECSAAFSLVDLDRHQLIKEMAFTLSLAPGSTAQINDLLAIDPACAPLSHRDLGGYLTGFIDLVCAHDERYYLVDYKTNQLGGENAYGRESLLAAMRAHHYGLQYWLYTIVLHRSLRCWLPDYRYERHFGGVIYPFLRGMHPDCPGSSVYFTVPDGDRVARLERCFAGGGR